ncbi:MAG: PAS domain S-box protein [Bacteroidales bacterium]|nr:PAS domain S-box protein [Bacteroidales bacterium]
MGSADENIRIEEQIASLENQLTKLKRQLNKQENQPNMLTIGGEVLYNLFSQATDAIVLANAQTGIIVYANKAACTLFGYSHETLSGKHFTFLHPEERRDFVKQDLEQILASKNLTAIVETNIENAEGKLVPVEITNTMVSHENYAPIMMGIFRDITKRKQF